jgi:hypothetical protein
MVGLHTCFGLIEKFRSVGRETLKKLAHLSLSFWFFLLGGRKMGNGKTNNIDTRLFGCRADGRRGERAGLARIVVLGVALLASAAPALGQYTVQPMKLDFQVRPGKLIVSSLNIESLDPNESHTIDLTLVDLTQNRDGGWEIIEPNSGFDLTKISSCRKGVQLTPSTVTVGPREVQPVEVKVAVPRGTRGFSCAGILAAVQPRPGDTDVDFVLRFMVPILVEVQGRPRPHRVIATDMTMQFRKAGAAGPATTTLTMDIENNGETFPRCRPVARIWSWAGGHWRIIKTTAFQDNSSDIGIIPGAKIQVVTDLRKSLPAGKYKIAGVLYVDGRRTRRIEKEFDFAGDPSATTVKADTPLDLKPADVTIESIPGATRTTMMTVYNGSDETVNVQTSLALPRDLGGKVMGGVRGAEMDCTKWIRVEPERFTLRGEADSQNIRIVSAMPNLGTMHPCYYTNLDFWAFYPDGQNAGLTTAKLCLQNTKATVAPMAQAEKLTPGAFSTSKYLISAKFTNVGTIHFDPLNCKATATQGGSTVPRASVRLDSIARGLMLPGEERHFSGILDFSTLPADRYRLSAGLEYAPGKWAYKQIQIRVSIEGDARIIETEGTQEELSEIIEVKWSRVPSNTTTTIGNKRG